VLYLKEKKPQIYEKITKILLIQDFIIFMFSGKAVTDFSTACRTMFFDVREGRWSGDLMEKFGLDIRHYSQTMPMGTVIGDMRTNLGAELGIKGKCKVVLGGHDQPVNAIGAGLRDGYAVCSMGTAECITPITGFILPEDFIAGKGIPSEPLWKKGKFCCLAYNSTSGLLMQWFVHTFSGGEGLPIEHFDQNIPPDPVKIMVQPYLMGSGTPYMDSSARLAIAGMDYSTNKYDIYRAVLEGLVLDQRLNMTVLEEQKVFLKHLIAVGGGSKSKPWLQIKADILRIPVSTLKVKEAGALGGAVLCAAASGVYGSIEEAAQNMSHISDTVDPNLKHQDFYCEKFELYRKLHDHVKEESAFAVKIY
jgi:xylulokinase